LYVIIIQQNLKKKAFMLALSIQQPWAWAILNAGKDIENRNWNTPIRGRVLIHASARFDKSAVDCFLDCFNIKVPQGLMCGGIVGSIEICGVVESSSSKWFYGPYGFVLRKPIIVSFFPCRGNIGFFSVDYKG
jgi:hypothetical protein